MADSIRFLLNGKPVSVRQPPPTLTILDWLREHRALTGSKEGCAEGDCGACTTVIGELMDDRLRLRPVNACIQFLVTLDGRALFTVDGLRSADGQLHPVQQAMVDAHASQCGFCTPGFVMSLFALYKSELEVGRQQVVEALSGNLCRCTGYRPIIDAGLSLFEPQRAAKLDAADWRLMPGPPGEAARELVDQLRTLAPQDMLTLDDQGWLRAPRDLDTLLALAADHPDATLLAGGTDVGLWVTKDYRRLDKIIYLQEVAELNRIAHNGRELEIGAAVSLSRAFAALKDSVDGLAEVFRRFASPPITSAGTLVGNLANGSPIGDSMPPLLCLGARLRLASHSGERELALDQFYLDYQKKDLRPGEVVVSVIVPLPESGSVLRCYKMAKRYDQDISSVCAAFLVKLEGNRVRAFMAGFGGMAAIPARAWSVEQTLNGEPWDEEAIERAVAALAEDFAPISDMRASADYRLTVAGNLLRKFHAEVCAPDQPARVFDLQAVAP